MIENEATNKAVLIVVGDGAAREAMMLAYGAAGFEVSAAGTMSAARELIGGAFDAVLSDAELADGEGIELLARASHLPIYFRCDSIEQRTRLSSAGAAGFLRADQPLPLLGQGASELSDDLGLTGGSAAMRALREQIRLLASGDHRILIIGATGVGKQRVIQALHQLGRRRHVACITVNAAAIPESLLDSELFGHAEGAFTDATKDRIGRFVEADGGVLVLDQVGDLPLAQQARLLRVLETGEVLPLGGQPVRVDVQVMATHHEPLQALVARGEFRADLYHRLAVHRVGVPSLAERLEDVPELVADLAPQFAQERRLIKRLQQESWPGNVRQLGHFLERITLLRRSGEALMPLVDAELSERQPAGVGGPWLRLPLADLVRQRVAASLPAEEELPERLYHEVLAEVERGLFGLVLERCGGKQLPAARKLGLNRNTLHKKLKALGMLKK